MKTLSEPAEIRTEYVGLEVLTPVVMKSAIFWDLTPCSPLKVNRSSGRTYRLHLQDRGISLARYHLESSLCLLPVFELKMEAICSSETSVDLTTRCYIPEGSAL
jgi:hypothetical protein